MVATLFNDIEIVCKQGILTMGSIVVDMDGGGGEGGAHRYISI